MRAKLIPSAGVSALVDTNVLLDFYSCHDLTKTFVERHALSGWAAIDDPDVRYRLTRARESILLAIYFDKIGAKTFSLRSEPIDILLKNAPPKAGGETMESDFTRAALHFVKDYALPGWVSEMPGEPDGYAKNDADTALLECARERGLPLITNEGHTAEGLIETKLRKRARQAGVHVYAPIEFFEGKLDVAQAAQAFINRLRAERSQFEGKHRARFGPDKMGWVLDWVIGYYRMVLLGEVNRPE